MEGGQRAGVLISHYGCCVDIIWTLYGHFKDSSAPMGCLWGAFDVLAMCLRDMLMSMCSEDMYVFCMYSLLLFVLYHTLGL